jgi:hypothetical protein
VYWPCPVMKRKSSLRRTDAPIPVALIGFILPLSFYRRSSEAKTQPIFIWP